MKPLLVIAGATGFIGRWFIERYSQRYRIRALSRSEMIPEPESEVEWKRVNLYSLSSTSDALEGADYALYLVHSMSPTSRLDQGEFQDTDILLADNFARGAAEQGVKHIIFIGGILPKDGSEFSTHLRSRYETEQTLKSGSTPVTSIRAGIIIGPGGSSFRIVQKLVEQLPVMACPKWCESPSQPIAINDMLEIIDRSFGNPDLYDRAIEVGSPEITSYMEMLRITSHKMGKKRTIFSIPFFTLGFSKLWVATFSNSSVTFVSPLIESLKHDMRVDQQNNPFQSKKHQSIASAIEEALSVKAPKNPRRRELPAEKNTVRSVQRMANPSGLSASWVAKTYPDWLSKKFIFFLTAKKKGDTVSFKLLGLKLLELKFIPSRSDDKRQLYFIVGGLLVKRLDYGWLEFRSVLNDRYIIAAIHEFVPRLPWYFYRITQAIFHLLVMRSYGKFLRKETTKRKFESENRSVIA